MPKVLASGFLTPTAAVGTVCRFRPFPNLQVGQEKTNWVCLYNPMKPDAKATPNRGLSFLDWAGALRADDSLSPGLRESYRRTLVDFLRFCQQRVADATGVLAREGVSPE